MIPDERRELPPEGSNVLRHCGRHLLETPTYMPSKTIEHDSIASSYNRAVVEAALHDDLSPRRPRKPRMAQEKVGAEAHVGEGLQAQPRAMIHAADALA